MEVKPGYKLTEVGVIPEDWMVTSVGDEFSIQLGKMLDTEKNAGVSKPYLGNRAVQWGRIDLADIGVIKLTSSDLRRFRLREGDLLVCEGGEIGRAAIWREPIEECYYQKALHRLRPIRGYNVQLMLYMLQRLASTGFLLNFVTQTSIAHLPKDKLQTVPIPLPPTKAEQDAVVEALGDMDALIGGLDRLVAKKRDLKRAAMQQLLTSQTRLQGFSGRWEVKRLGDIGDITSAGVDKKSRPGEIPVRLVNYLDVYRKDFISSDDLTHWVTAPPHQSRRCAVQKGDVFFTPSSETRDDIGISAVAIEDIPDAAYSYHVVRLRLKEDWDLLFRTYAFKTRAFLDQAETLCDGSGTRYVISQGKFRSMTLKVPPVPEQTAIAAVLSDMDAEIGALERRLAKTRALKQGMMQELLTGKTRLTVS